MWGTLWMKWRQQRDSMRCAALLSPPLPRFVQSLRGLHAQVARQLRGPDARTNFNSDGVLCEEVTKLVRGSHGAGVKLAHL